MDIAIEEEEEWEGNECFDDEVVDLSRERKREMILELKHIKNGTRMWNMVKCFISEFKRVGIEKVCWKAK